METIDIVKVMGDPKNPASYIGLRLTAKQRKFLEDAADADHRKLSDFVRLAALQRAEETLGRSVLKDKPSKSATGEKTKREQ